MIFSILCILAPLIIFFSVKVYIPKRFLFLLGSSLCLILVLQYIWYNNMPKEGFHFFDDSHEWLFMDKLGHLYFCFWLTRSTFIVLNQKLKNNNQLFFNLFWIGFWLPATIEISDGFGVGYGFSVWDILADLVGFGLAIGLIYCQKNYFIFKFSFIPSLISNLRPHLMGSNYIEKILKDYNGQIYWIAIPFNETLGINLMPKWMLLSIGYGADGMIGGSDNSWISDSNQTFDHIDRNSEWYFSIDVDFEQIPVGNKFLRIILFPLNLIKLPIPSIRLLNQEISFLIPWFS